MAVWNRNNIPGQMFLRGWDFILHLSHTQGVTGGNVLPLPETQVLV